MGAYVLRRLAAAAPMLALVTVAAFFLLHWLPGDPVRAMLGQRATAENVDRLRVELGLDKPKHEQFGRWVTDLSQGDLGESHRSNRPVMDELKERVPATIELSLLAMLIATIVGIGLGIVAAIRPRTVYDFACLGCALLGISLPIFWLGFLAQTLFAGHLQWLPFGERLDVAAWPTFDPVTGFYLWDAAVVYRSGELTWDVIRHLTLPALVLSTVPMALIARMTRSSMLDVLSLDYIRTANAKGLAPKRVILRHALRNALIPVVTSVGVLTGTLLGGAVLTETVFAWPGLGTYTVEAIIFRDGKPLQAAVLLVAVSFVFVNLLTDLSYALIDPRLRDLDTSASESGGLRGWKALALVAALPLGVAAIAWPWTLLTRGETALGSALVLLEMTPLFYVAYRNRGAWPDVARRVKTSLAEYWKFSRGHKPALVGLALVGTMVVTAVFADVIAPYGAMENVGITDGAPSADHLFGTTAQARDLFSRIVYGARVTLLVALAAMSLSMLLGSLIGALAGYFGGLVDMVLMRFIDFMLSFPSFFLAMIIVTLLGRSLENLIWAVGLVGIPLFARQVRAEVLRVKALDYVEAVRALGFAHPRILGLVVLPNCLTPITVLATLGLGSAILNIAGLGFLGLGGDPFVPEWGMILKAGWDESSEGAFQVFVSGMCILCTVLGFSLMGDGLRDWLDPRQR